MKFMLVRLLNAKLATHDLVKPVFEHITSWEEKELF